MIDVGAVSYLIKMLLTITTTINEVASKGFITDYVMKIIQDDVLKKKTKSNFDSNFLKST
jgi:hypothetical protein